MAHSPMVAARLHIDQALRHRGCPLCYLGAMEVRRYLWYLLYEAVTSPTTHDKLERSWGFCNLHAWLVQEMNWRQDQDGMSTANLCVWQIDRYRDILQTHLDRSRRHPPTRPRLRRRPPRPWLAQAILADLTPAAECPACAVQRESEQAAIGVLVQDLRDRQDLRAQYEQSFGLCLPHFKVFLEQAAAEEDVLAFIIGVQIDKLTALSAELAEYLRKHDYRFSHEPYGEERDAFIRATEMLAGAKRDAVVPAPMLPQQLVSDPQGMEGTHGGGSSGPGEPPQSFP